MVRSCFYYTIGDFMTRKMIRNVGRWTGLLLFVLFLSGCEQKTINEIKSDPGRFAKNEVVIVGTVVRSVSVMGNGVYEIDDGTGKLWVVSRNGVPRKGAKIGVKGKVHDAYDLSSFALPESISSGLVLIEASHKSAANRP
jgi:hypothetical protein